MDIAKKMQLAPDQHIEVVRSPAPLPSTLLPLTSLLKGSATPAALFFALDRDALEAQRASIVASAMADRLTWVAYPKAGQLATDLNRDTLSAALARSGVQPVRQIAIDDVWSALRFRPGK
jgi:hypothetical protein